MRKSLKKIMALAMVATLAMSAVPVQAAPANLITTTWECYFGASAQPAWTEGAVGELTQNEVTDWAADMQMIGWGGIWGAQVKNENLKYQKGLSYTVSCTLESSTIDKWVLIKVEGDDPKAYDPGRAALAFKWVKLKVGESQDVSFDFTLPKNYNGHLSLYFGIGGEMGDREDEKLNGLYDGLAELPKDGDATYSAGVRCSDISVTQAATSIKKVQAKKGSAKVAINKSASAKKYVVQYSTKSSMGGAKKVKTSKTNVTIKKLTSGKKYYFRVAIVNANGKQSKVWSDKKSVKIK